MGETVLFSVLDNMQYSIVVIKNSEETIIDSLNFTPTESGVYTANALIYNNTYSERFSTTFLIKRDNRLNERIANLNQNSGNIQNKTPKIKEFSTNIRRVNVEVTDSSLHYPSYQNDKTIINH